jgi:hypothetical protein
MDLLSFNAILRAAVDVQNDSIKKRAISMRAAFGAEGKDWTEFLNALCGEDELQETSDINDLIRQVGSF